MTITDITVVKKWYKMKIYSKQNAYLNILQDRLRLGLQLRARLESCERKCQNKSTEH